MDGWGIGKKDQSDAVDVANTPFVDSLYTNYPNATLKTYGEHVGLPSGQMGNSEVGHLNIGAGRVVYQDLMKINKARGGHLHRCIPPSAPISHGEFSPGPNFVRKSFRFCLKILRYIRNIHGKAFIILWYDSNNSTFPIKK